MSLRRAPGQPSEPASLNRYYGADRLSAEDFGSPGGARLTCAFAAAFEICLNLWLESPPPAVLNRLPVNHAAVLLAMLKAELARFVYVHPHLLPAVPEEIRDQATACRSSSARCLKYHQYSRRTRQCRIWGHAIKRVLVQLLVIGPTASLYLVGEPTFSLVAGSACDLARNLEP